MDDSFIKLIFHGRGGQGAITAGELLCDFAYFSGYKDVLNIPKIGAERRGAPIKTFVKLSKEKEIKDYSNVIKPDVCLIFDTSLLSIPGVVEEINAAPGNPKVILNSNEENFDVSIFNSNVEVYQVDGTGISIDIKLVVAGNPILNVPLLGAYAQVMGDINFDEVERILKKRFGPKGALNYEAVKKAAKEVKRIQ